MAWTKDGDRNTKFYHAVIKERRKKQIMQIALDNGEVTNSAQIIVGLATDFFSNIFAASIYQLENNLFEGVQPVISHQEDNQFN